MKKVIITSLFCLLMVSFNASAQRGNGGERYGKTLNLGLGIGGYSGYYGYVGHTMPVLHIDYEFDVANSFTLAPFVSFYTYSNDYYWDHGYYTYRETVIPLGVKGTYYFDKIFEANSNWDFYLAGSLGFAIVSESWDNNYYGDKNHFNHGSPLFLDLHLGAEYHFNNHIGMFLDLSTGVSTIGLAFH